MDLHFHCFIIGSVTLVNYWRIPQKVISAGVLTNPYEINTIKEPAGIDGKYVKIPVIDGEQVKKGQIIAKLEVESLKKLLLLQKQLMKKLKICTISNMNQNYLNLLSMSKRWFK